MESNVQSFDTPHSMTVVGWHKQQNNNLGKNCFKEQVHYTVAYHYYFIMRGCYDSWKTYVCWNTLNVIIFINEESLS